MVICQKRPNFRIPYFRPSKCRPLLSAARGGCPLALPVPPPLVRESEMFIKDKAKITSRVSGIKRSVLYFSKLSPMRRNFVLEELRVERLAVIHEEIFSSAFYVTNGRIIISYWIRHYTTHQSDVYTQGWPQSRHSRPEEHLERCSPAAIADNPLKWLKVSHVECDLHPKIRHFEGSM